LWRNLACCLRPLVFPDVHDRHHGKRAHGIEKSSIGRFPSAS
jgi:hypothetical protein